MSEPGLPRSDADGATTPSAPSARPAGSGERRHRLGDRLTGPMDAFHIVTAASPEAADAALERLLDSDAVESEMLQELLTARSLADPDRFLPAHRALVRALEIYDRNARRSPSRLPAGVLRPVATPIVTLLSMVIARTFQKQVVRDVRRLYLMREASSRIGGADHRMLVTVRRQLDRLQPDLAGGGFAIPAFLLGGAVLSAVVSALQNLLHSEVGRLALLAAILLLTVGAFWCLVSAAAVTRRRTRLVLDQPLAELWTAVGNAGRPPRDPSRTFVLVAALLLVLGWVIAPAAAALLYRFT